MPDEPDPPECIYCGGNARDVERRGPEWFCNCCARTWLALSKQDKVRLKLDKIAQEG